MARDRNVLDLLNRTFTPEQKALIEERQTIIRDILRAAYEEQQFIALTTAQSLRSRGGVTRERLLVFGKLALLNRGAALIEQWESINAELIIPWSVHYWEIAVASWASRGVNATFLRTNMSPSPADTTLYGEGWTSEADTDVPGVSTVDDSDVFHWLGFVGGDPPHFHHIEVSPPIRKITMLGGAKYTVQFRAEGGEPPIVWSISGPEWMTIDATGLVTLAPPELPEGTVGSAVAYAAVTAKGQQDAEGQAALNVEVYCPLEVRR